MVFCARLGKGLPHLNQNWRQVSNPMPLCLKFLTGQLGIPKPPPSGHLSLSSRYWHSPFKPLFVNSNLLTPSFFIAFNLYLYNPTPLHFMTRLSCFLTPGLCQLAAPCTSHDPLLQDRMLTRNQNTYLNTLVRILTYTGFSLITHTTSKTVTDYSLRDHSDIMENLFSTSSANTGNTTNTTTASSPIMGCPQNSQFSSIYGPLSYPSTPPNSFTQSNCFPPQYNYMPPPCESLQFPYTHSLEQPSQYVPSADPFYPVMAGQNVFEMQRSCILQPSEIQLEQERRAFEAYKTKVARCMRRLARQRSLSSRNAAGASSSQIMDARRLALHGASAEVQNSRSNTSSDLYRFLTPDNKRLRVLLRKELKNSDVGSLGRIVLPKREVEENLPVLNDKEGILLVFQDAFSDQEWALKFKYWTNNKSRMYVLENTGEFVKRYGLETGDSLTLYEDESKNLYFSVAKVGRPALMPSQTPQPTANNYNYIHTPHLPQARDEERSSIALLIEQIGEKEQEEANSPMAVPMDSAFSYTTHQEQLTNDPLNNLSTYSQPASSAMQPSSPNGKMKAIDDSHIDDCYTGLGMLPDVYRYNFSL